jgi:uncharacterized protein (TIGR02246 family)
LQPGHDNFSFAGSALTNFTARSIQSVNCSSSSTPSGPTSTQPFMARPVMSNSRTCGSRSASSWLSVPSRAISESFQTPTSMLPWRRKPTPPNIFFSSMFLRQASRCRMRSARASLKAIGHSHHCNSRTVQHRVFYRKAPAPHRQQEPYGEIAMARPMTTEDTGAHDEEQIRQLITDWTAAQCAKNVEGVMSHYAEDVSVFGVTPPLVTQGAASWRSIWEARLPHFPHGFQIEMRDLRIRVSGSVAVAHWLCRFTGMRADVPSTQSWFRLTVGYQKRHDQWQIVHEHYSVPFDPATSQAVFTLD